MNSLFFNNNDNDTIVLKQNIKDMIAEISRTTELSQKSISDNHKNLDSSFQWFINLNNNSKKFSIETPSSNYFRNFDVIFDHLMTIYDNSIEDKKFLTSINKSFHLLKQVNEAICENIEHSEYKIEQLKSVLNSISLRLTNIDSITNTEQKLDIFKEEMDRILNESISKFNNRASELYSDLSQSINEKVVEQISSRQKEIDKEVIGFAELRLQLSEQVELFSSATMADQNQQQAKEEAKTADRLRIVGGVWLLIVSSISFYFFYELLQSSKTYDISMLIFRWMSVLFMTIPGIYILRESSIHRTDARKYRRLAIQLATINSYLATFEKDDAREVKRSLISNFFSSDETKIDFSSVPDLLKSFENVQDTILSIASKQPSQKANSDKEDVTPEK